MNVWTTHFQTLRSLDEMPRLATVSEEEWYNTAYHHEGSTRPNEQHAIFKYTLAGEGVFRNADGEHRIPPEHGFLTIINDPETAYYYPPDATDYWRIVYVAFHGQVARRMVAELVERYGPVFHLSPTSTIINRIMACRRHADGHHVITAGEGADLVFSLFTALSRSKEAQLEREPGHRLVLRVQDEINKQPDHNHTVSELAELLTVSREHLSRTYRRETGHRLHDYLIRRRVIRACSLLQETTMSCKEIAHRLHFGATPTFTRTFKRVTGMTPTQFRTQGIPPVW